MQNLDVCLQVAHEAILLRTKYVLVLLEHVRPRREQVDFAGVNTVPLEHVLRVHGRALSEFL